jgi:SUMO ligase MMS21 Smc5/6 complex component
VDNILKSDDKLLLSLQKLASDLDPGQSGDDDTIARIRDLCARYLVSQEMSDTYSNVSRLIKHTVEGIRTRLDRIYLDTLKSSNTSNGHDSDNQEVSDLQEELESLYSEILPVAQMSAEQQYLEPALRVIAATNGQGQERSVKAVKYVSFPCHSRDLTNILPDT